MFNFDIERREHLIGCMEDRFKELAEARENVLLITAPGDAPGELKVSLAGSPLFLLYCNLLLAREIQEDLGEVGLSAEGSVENIALTLALIQALMED